MPRPSILFLLLWSAVFLVADVASKAWAVSKLEGTGTRRIVVIDGLFNFDLAKNHGGAFGFLGDQPEAIRLPFFFGISAIAVFFVVSLFRKLEPGQTALKWALPLVLGGAAGNLIDRVRHQYVIDFLDVYFTFIKVEGDRPYHWPTFNVADIWICVGVGLMAVDMLTHRPAKPKVRVERIPVKPDKPTEQEQG